MPVGKAKAIAVASASDDFTFVVPCCTSIDEARIRGHLERDHFFWLDLTAPSHDDLSKLQELFGFHPLALEDTEHFGQRPKLDNFGDYVFLVFYGAWRHRDEDPEPLREVHLFISGQFLVTIHRDEITAASESKTSGVAASKLDTPPFLAERKSRPRGAGRQPVVVPCDSTTATGATSASS